MTPTRMNKISDAGRERAVSEIIGSIMLISVVVIAVAVVGVVLTSQGTPQKIPALDAVISNFGNTIQIYHNGGDTLQKADMEILVDGQEKPFSKGSDPSWTSWSAGDSLVYKVPDGQPMPQIVNIVFKGAGAFTVLTTADFSPGGMTNTGPIATETLRAVFSGSPVSGSPPLVVQFTDLSTGYPVGWSWSFGDTQTSTAKNPTHVYSSTGTFTVTLTVTNSTGSMDTKTQTGYITITATPAGPVTADFSGSPSSGSVPLTVQFADASTGSPTEYLWNFGDTQTSTLRNPSHTYSSTTGSPFTVSLRVGNGTGIYNTKTQANYITVTSVPVTPVTSDFAGSPTSGTVPLTVQFVDASTGSPSEYLWNFGDTQTSTLRNPSHTYSSTTGSPFTVSLRVGNGTGIYNTKTQTGYITVSAAPTPPPKITTVTPVTVTRNVNTAITIDGTGFQSPIGTTEVLFRRHGTTTVIAGTTVAYVSSTRITCMFRSANTAGLVYDIQVINPDYQTAIKANAITTV